MNRRQLLAALGALTATAVSPPRFSFGQTERDASSSSATLSFEPHTPGPSIPLDFIGLSYESAQLANPGFFSHANKQLIHLFRELSPHGNLRLGGGSSEFTTYSDETSRDPLPFEVFGPDTSKTVKHGTTTTALALHNLREFLDATKWNCLYGLNLGQGTAENAAWEAAAAHRILGSRLLALQIGNEPDSFRNRYRAASYGPQDYVAEWIRFHDAIVKLTPQARFAGPDISNKLAYLTAFAQEAQHHNDIVLLTGHYYAMGPARSPLATLDQLFEPDPKLATMKRRDLHLVTEAMQTAHLPFRVSEANSCWDGGKPGVSDTFASALWCADYLLQCAAHGWSGVNLHGGGNGFYTPIAGAPSTGFVRRPEYFGIQFAQHFAGSRLLPVSGANDKQNVSVYAFERDGKRELAIINKQPVTCTLNLPPDTDAKPMLRLSAPSVESKESIKLAALHGPRSRILSAAPYTANIYRL